MALHFRDSLDRPNRRPRGKQNGVAVFVAVLAGIFADSPRTEGLTSVDCDTPDDFCTGDPCETPDSIVITVSSCVLDFSPRKLVIARKVFVPDNGTLSLTAGSIDMNGKLDGKHTSGAGNGADITLIASGDILVKGRIDVAGRTTVGTIVLDAGGDIDLEHQLRARVRGSGATASGGTVSVDADGALTSTRRGKIDVRGRHNNTAAGQATLRGATGVTLTGRIEARGEPGGSVTVESSAGNVTLQEEIRVQGTPAGQVTMNAGADVSIGGRKGRIRADGGFGEISIDAGGLVSSRTISARGSNALGLPGGTVAVLAGSVSIERFLVRGFDGGLVDVESTVGNVDIFRDIDVRGKSLGGTVRIDSAADIFVKETSADGPIMGGEIRVDGAGNVFLGDSTTSDFRVDSDVAGGVIEASAGGNLTLQGDFVAEVGGCIGLSAGGTLDTSQADFDVAVTASCP